ISCGAPLWYKNNQTSVLVKSSLCLLAAIIFLLMLVSTASADSTLAYKVKAGIVYNFSLFTKWQEDAFAKDPHNFHIGVVGKNPFGNALNQAASRPVSGREPMIHYFDSIPSPAELQKCQMIFITSSMVDQTDEIFKLISGFPVLTISDMDNFLEKGGMISLVTRRNRIKFEVNRKTARDAGIEFRSQMLKMALRVLER
ncbi:MAG: YfiR family protein, partial [Desulfobacula sp.]|nr:YfiR family protein [Desulfobacula sp.]